MSTASIQYFPGQSSFDENPSLPGEKAAAEALFKMVAELDQSSSGGGRARESRSGSSPAPLSGTSSRRQLDSGANASDDSADVSKTFCEWLTTVRSLQRKPADRKKMIASFAMLVFHSGVDASGEDALLSKAQLDFVGRAPGWNQNERKIIAVLKNHFHTIRQLSGQNHQGISYADITSIFSSKKKIKERLALAACEEGSGTGTGIGLIFQIFTLLVAFEFGIHLAVLFSVIGFIVGFCKEKSVQSTITTGIKWLVWGVSAGSAMGAVVAANQASRQFDENLASQVDLFREELAQITFEAV